MGYSVTKQKEARSDEILEDSYEEETMVFFEEKLINFSEDNPLKIYFGINIWVLFLFCVFHMESLYIIN